MCTGTDYLTTGKVLKSKFSEILQILFYLQLILLVGWQSLPSVYALGLGRSLILLEAFRYMAGFRGTKLGMCIKVTFALFSLLLRAKRALYGNITEFNKLSALLWK